jgi:integrase
LRAWALQISPGAPVHLCAFATVNKQEGRTGTLSRQFSELMAQAGLGTDVSHASKRKGRSAKRTASDTSFHSIRHSAVSLLKDAGIPDATIMELVGHQSAAMSAHYTHVGHDSLTKAANSLPKI